MPPPAFDDKPLHPRGALLIMRAERTIVRVTSQYGPHWEDRGLCSAGVPSLQSLGPERWLTEASMTVACLGGESGRFSHYNYRQEQQ